MIIRHACPYAVHYCTVHCLQAISDQGVDRRLLGPKLVGYTTVQYTAGHLWSGCGPVFSGAKVGRVHYSANTLSAGRLRSECGPAFAGAKVGRVHYSTVLIRCLQAVYGQNVDQHFTLQYNTNTLCAGHLWSRCGPAFAGAKADSTGEWSQHSRATPGRCFH